MGFHHEFQVFPKNTRVVMIEPDDHADCHADIVGLNRFHIISQNTAQILSLICFF